MPSGRSPPPGFGIITRRTGCGSIRLGAQVLAQAGQPLLQSRRLDLRERHPVHARRTRIGTSQRVGVGENIVAIDLVVELIEAEVRLRLRLDDRASSEVSGSFRVLPGSSPITPSSTASKAHQKSGSFPPPELPGLDGTMTLSDSRPGRRPRRALEVATLAPRRVSPDYPQSPFQRAVPTTPADRTGASVDCFPVPCGLPRYSGGSASATSLSRPAQASLTLRPAGSLNRPRRPLSRGFDAAGYPTTPLVSYQINRQLSGWNLPPLTLRAFGAHCLSP